ncbi:Citrate, pro-3S-lyase ligase [Enterococcus mundtii 3F]|uniref:[citrate (pro-3S)-lyase] ligase n=1 Tax=Enterococcus mundtii TaxID=53346 RepID=UPI0023020AFA|nr:[citrate (pro-3S)-lyase] ligase [Enterococcus mundtii]MDA9462181.1 Citrate, pro-3S-lyase ligase [Enterococcus mundtii 3F]
MYTIKRLWLKKDAQAYQQWVALIEKADLLMNEKVDYTVGIYQEERLIATGSYEKNILKYLVVDKEFQSENLLTKIVQQLIDQLSEENKRHFFVYTNPSNHPIFQAMGFKEIIATKSILFMEQGTPDFQDYLAMLKSKKKKGIGCGIVMNANPFTKGHQYLVECAAKQADQVYLFVLSEDRSEFSFTDRLEMVKQGVAHVKNVTILPTEDYLISSATFPAYFLKEHATEEAAKAQGTLDALLFKEKIAPLLAIESRFVGEEPYSKVTENYNETLKKVFGESLSLIVLPRKCIKNEVISATKVRKALQEDDVQTLQAYLPASTYNYIKDHKYNRGDNT